MPILVATLALILVTAIHEAGHFLAVRAKGGRVLRVQVGRGPDLWSATARGTEVAVALVPIGGRIRYDRVPGGTGEAVVAVAGSAANLGVALLAFAIAALLLAPMATPLRPADMGPFSYAAASTGGWFWAVPGALVELIATGGATELRRAIAGLLDLVVAAPVRGTPYMLGAMSAMWAALNLIPIPVVGTDGWHLARALWPTRRAPDPRSGV